MRAVLVVVIVGVVQAVVAAVLLFVIGKSLAILQTVEQAVVTGLAYFLWHGWPWLLAGFIAFKILKRLKA